MSDQVIGQGPSNPVPNGEKIQFLAGSVAIVEGQVLSLLVGATNPAGDSDTEYIAITVVQADSDGTDLNLLVGVAAEAIAAGEWGSVYVSGYCPKVLTDGTVAVGDFLVPHTVAGEATVMLAAVNDASGEEHLVFGQALITDHETVEECACILRRMI